jgi:hypothetical protein
VNKVAKKPASLHQSHGTIPRVASKNTSASPITGPTIAKFAPQAHAQIKRSSLMMEDRLKAGFNKIIFEENSKAHLNSKNDSHSPGAGDPNPKSTPSESANEKSKFSRKSQSESYVTKIKTQKSQKIADYRTDPAADLEFNVDSEPTPGLSDGWVSNPSIIPEGKNQNTSN